MREELTPWILLGLALALTPTYGFSTVTVPKGTNADVVDGDAYVEAVSLSPVLNASNGYQSDAITVTHQHGASVTLDADVENAALDPRFVMLTTGFILDPGDQETVRIEDQSEDHEPGTYNVTATVEASTIKDGETVGYQTFDVAVTVTVEEP